MKVAVLGIDLGKNSCSVVGLDHAGTVVKRRRMRPESIPAFTRTMPTCTVAMEACCGAHHFGRLLRSQGHTVRLISPEYVRPYVKAQKNDDRDAEAIAEAATRPTMRFVELKSEEQLDMQTLHRVRDRLVGERTALINQLRAILLERGCAVPQGRRKLEQHLAAMPDPDNDTSLSPRVRRLIDDMRAEWLELDQRIATFDNEFAARARSDADARRLATIPGIGVLNATALVAAIGLLWFKEPLGALKIVALCFIIAGVVGLNLSGASHHETGDGEAEPSVDDQSVPAALGQPSMRRVDQEHRLAETDRGGEAPRLARGRTGP